MPLPLSCLVPTTSTNTVSPWVTEGSDHVRRALPHSFSAEERPHFSAVSFIHILTLLGPPGKGVTRLINSRIQVLVRLVGTPENVEVAPGLAGALGAQVSSGVLCTRCPHPEFLRPLERSLQLSDCLSAGPVAGLRHPRMRTNGRAQARG